MAQTKNVIKKLETAGATITRKDSRHFVARFPAANVEVTDQNGEAISIYVIKHGAQDELVSDYFAGSFKDNAAQAIDLARRMESW